MRVKATVKRYEEDIFLFKDQPHKFKLYSKGEIRVIELKEYESVCCDEMRNALEDGFIHFGNEDGKNPNLNIYKEVSYPSGSFRDEMAIYFCPFCGEKVEIEITENDEEKQ